jgi:signal transduction histidine kinase/CheY-like chemotaxis protein/HPt (histidine-containing phosphotransfer) domain-containing protein
MESQRYLQLKEQYDNAQDEKERIDLLISMTLEIRTDDPERALIMAEEIVERSEAIHYPAGIGNGLNHKGACYWLIGEYEDGLDELTAALAIAEETKNKELEAKVLNNFGRIYRELGDIATALRHFEDSLEINEAMGNELNLTINLTNISNLYYDLGDYDTALEYAVKCLPIFERYEDSTRLVSIYTTLGNIYFKKDMFEESLRYFEYIRNSTEEDTTGRVLADSGIGKVYYRMHDYENAKKFLTLALEKAKEVNNPETEIIASFYLGRLYMDQHIFRKALEYLIQASNLAQEYLRRQDMLSIHEALSDLYDKMGDIPKAFHHLKAYEKLKEEIFQQATLNKLRNLQVKSQIEVAKKEKEVAERTATLKQQFMANMSHEIRTPMNAIVGITRLLLEKNPKPEQLTYLNAIRKSADNLLVIINDILDLSKIEAGKIVIEQTDFSLREVIENIRDIMQLKAEEKNLQFEVSVDDSIPDRLIGDPTRLNQILINLIGNAVKFTEQGYVKLVCTTERVDTKELRMVFKVIDTGIGISQEYVQRIFDSFTQAGTDTARKYGGTGLGLTISKQMVDLMHGKISVDSVLGEGTTFTVVIPLGIAENQNPPEEKQGLTDDAKQSLQSLCVLLAEDNEFNRLVAEDTLRDLLPDITIDIAENGAIAIQKLEQHDYDLILMDIQMPVKDGLEATRHIRRNMPAPKNKTRIIAMTANVLQDDVQKYFAEGMNAYISKPFQTEELLEKMAAVMKGDQPSDKNPSKHDQSDEPMTLPAKITDMQFLMQFTGGKPDKKNKYIQMFLENAPKLLNNIKHGLADGNYEAVKVAAHSMKPQMSYMGIKEEISHIYLIEKSAGEAAHHGKLPDLVQHLERVCEKAFSELNAEIFA